MKYLKPYSWRLAEKIVDGGDSCLQKEYNEVLEIIDNVSDDDIESQYLKDIESSKSQIGLSQTLNKIFKDRFVKNGWDSETFIFKEEDYKKKSKGKAGPWQIDFTKQEISLEVAFNHQNDIPLNLVNPMLACEDNHVKKEKETSMVVIICASTNLKDAGNFDPGIGNFEKIKAYIKPYSQILLSPMLIIPLQATEDFFIPTGYDINTEKNYITKVGDRVYVHNTLEAARKPEADDLEKAKSGTVSKYTVNEQHISIEINLDDGEQKILPSTRYLSCIAK